MSWISTPHLSQPRRHVQCFHLWGTQSEYIPNEAEWLYIKRFPIELGVDIHKWPGQNSPRWSSVDRCHLYFKTALGDGRMKLCTLSSPSVSAMAQYRIAEFCTRRPKSTTICGCGFRGGASPIIIASPSLDWDAESALLS